MTRKNKQCAKVKRLLCVFASALTGACGADHRATADGTAGTVPPSELLFGETHPIRFQTICRLHSRPGLYPQTNGEAPPLVSKQSTDYTAGLIPPNELRETHPIRIQTSCRLHSLGLYHQANFCLEKRLPQTIHRLHSLGFYPKRTSI